VTETTASEAVVIDSSGWLEYITGDEKADLFAPYFENDVQVLVPVIVLYEVRKVLLRGYTKANVQAFESEALQRQVIDIDEHIALSAATDTLVHRLAMADALIYATARRHRARLITSDSHFASLPGVTVL
jgi:predicted nucleic acid-binding protein